MKLFDNLTGGRLRLSSLATAQNTPFCENAFRRAAFTPARRVKKFRYSERIWLLALQAAFAASWSRCVLFLRGVLSRRNFHAADWSLLERFTSRTVHAANTFLKRFTLRAACVRATCVPRRMLRASLIVVRTVPFSAWQKCKVASGPMPCKNPLLGSRANRSDRPAVRAESCGKTHRSAAVSSVSTSIFGPAAHCKPCGDNALPTQTRVGGDIFYFCPSWPLSSGSSLDRWRRLAHLMKAVVASQFVWRQIAFFPMHHRNGLRIESPGLIVTAVGANAAAGRENYFRYFIEPAGHF